MARIFEEPVTWVVETLVAIVAFVIAIALGVLIPGMVAMKLLHGGGWIEYGPDAPGLLWEALRYALIAAAALVLGGRILGLERHGLFVVSYIAFQFAYAFLMPLLFASLISMPVHAVVSPLFGVDVWIVWRPLLHVAFAVGLALMSLKMHFDEAHTYYEGDTAPRYRRPRFRGRVGTGAVAFGEMVGSLSRPSGDSAGGSWSDDSDGGDSD